jgi:perosamine synthetase
MPSIHLMSYYRERYDYRLGMLPICEGVAARSLALPFFPEMTASQVERVVAELVRALGR